MNVIPAEVCKAGVIRSLKCFIKSLRIVSHEWIDATVVSLFKSGLRVVCGNFRGISLLLEKSLREFCLIAWIKTSQLM